MAVNQGPAFKPGVTIILSATFLGIMAFAYYFSGQPPLPAEDTGAAGAPPPFVKEQLEAYQQVLRYDPRNLAALMGLGNLYFDANKWSQAAEYYQRALAIEPKRDDVRTDMGIAYFNMGLNDVAAGEFRKVIAHNPHHANAGYNLGIVLHSTGHTAEARAVWRRTLPYAPPEIARKIHRMLGDKSS